MVAEFRSLGPGAKVAGQDAGELADGPVRGEPRPAPLQEHLLPRAAGRKGAGEWPSFWTVGCCSTSWVMSPFLRAA